MEQAYVVTFIERRRTGHNITPYYWTTATEPGQTPAQMLIALNTKNDPGRDSRFVLIGAWPCSAEEAEKIREEAEGYFSA